MAAAATTTKRTRRSPATDDQVNAILVMCRRLNSCPYWQVRRVLGPDADAENLTIGQAGRLIGELRKVCDSMAAMGYDTSMCR